MYARTIRTLKTLLHPAIIALVIAALLTSIVSPTVSAAAIQSALSSVVKNQFVRDTLVSVKPALHATVNDVVFESTEIMVTNQVISLADANKFRKIFIEGKAPQGMPKIAHALSLPMNQRVNYALQELKAAGKLTNAEAQMLLDLRAAKNEEARAKAVALLENGSYGKVATAILQVVVDLTSIDTDAELETCEVASSTSSSTSSSDVAAQGFLGNVLNWLGGLVDAVLDGAIMGAFYGMLVGRAEVGAIIGGIAGGIKYIADSTGGNGFKPGPNGEDCTGWPPPFPRF